MHLVSIPVHPLSYKILMRDLANTDGVISAHALRSQIYDHLHHKWSGFHQRNKMTRQYCTKIVQIEVGKHLYKRLDKHTYQVGPYLYQIHRNIMLYYMLGHISAGGNALSALNEFYNLYDITDEDYDREAAYKAWIRFFKSWREKTPYNLRKKKPQRTRQYGKNKIIFTPLEPEELQNRLSIFIAWNIDNFTYRHKWNKKVYLQAQAYFYTEFGKMSQDHIAMIQKTSQQTVSFRVNKFREWLSYDKDMRGKLTKVFLDISANLEHELRNRKYTEPVRSISY